jgi:hypothetical protein
MLNAIRRYLTKSIRRRVLTGFGVITALILVATANAYLGLNQIRTSSAETISVSEGIVHVQDYALAIEAVEKNLGRLSVTGSGEVEDALNEEIVNLNEAVTAIGEHTPEELLKGAGVDAGNGTTGGRNQVPDRHAELPGANTICQRANHRRLLSAG